MSDNFEEFCKTHSMKDRVCGAAYTINDFQPVICTHIGDQPLFYFDEEIIEEEEEELLFNTDELGFLAHEIQTLKNEIADMESPVLSIKEETKKSIELFSQNAESMNQDFYMSDAETDIRLQDIISILKESRLCAAYLMEAEKYDIKIMMSEQVEKAFYDRRSGSISLYPHMDKTEQVLQLACELRRHWQHRQGALINPLMFQPEHAVLINRAQEADLAVSVIRTAWELQLAGIRDVWERVENSPMADLARAYAREAFLDFRTINNGTASASVFEAWFLSERCRQQDKKIIQSMLADYKGYVFEHGTSSENVTAELIAALGIMPFGKNYLAAHAPIIMDDPIFTEVRDRSNANFLWFIKFERSFKETEQHLQLDSDLSTHGDIRHDLLNQSQDHKNEHKQSADVIQLFEYQSEDKKPKRKASFFSRKKPEHVPAGESAQIIDMQRWSKKG
ncbi:MAG: DUF6782 family putative metallopeptidase [Alphaproteobacteria bacterium]